MLIKSYCQWVYRMNNVPFKHHCKIYIFGLSAIFKQKWVWRHHEFKTAYIICLANKLLDTNARSTKRNLPREGTTKKTVASTTNDSIVDILFQYGATGDKTVLAAERTGKAASNFHPVVSRLATFVVERVATDLSVALPQSSKHLFQITGQVDHHTIAIAHRKYYFVSLNYN